MKTLDKVGTASKWQTLDSNPEIWDLPRPIVQPEIDVRLCAFSVPASPFKTSLFLITAMPTF